MITSETDSKPGESTPLVSSTFSFDNKYGKDNSQSLSSQSESTFENDPDVEQQLDELVKLATRNNIPPSNNINADQHPLPQKQRKRSRTEILLEELNHMLRLAFPVIGTYLLEMLPGIVSIMLVGHIPSPSVAVYIDGTTLSVMIFNLLGCSVGFGLATAMDTLCSQAFGAGDTKRMGRYLQTGGIVLSLAFSVICVVLYYTTDILLQLGQPVEVSQYAGEFSRILIPGLPFLYLFELLKKILQAQNRPMAMLYACIVSNTVNILAGYYFVYCTSMGWIGAAVSRTVSNVVAALILCVYMKLNGLFGTFWSGWELKKAFGGIREFISLGVPGMLQIMFEWWAFEILALISGLLPNPVTSIGANSLMMQISSLIYMVYLGISISGNVRIGNALGAGNPQRAKLASQLTFGLSIIASLFSAAFLLLERKALPLLFTHDDGIVDLTRTVLYVSVLFQLSDAINAACGGIFRGTGQQIIGAKLNFCAYYILGIPLGSYLAFRWKFGVVGLWLGMTLGLTACGASGTFIVWRNNWDDLSMKAMQRVQDKDSVIIDGCLQNGCHLSQKPEYNVQ